MEACIEPWNPAKKENAGLKPDRRSFPDVSSNAQVGILPLLYLCALRHLGRSDRAVRACPVGNLYCPFVVRVATAHHFAAVPSPIVWAAGANSRMSVHLDFLGNTPFWTSFFGDNGHNFNSPN